MTYKYDLAVFIGRFQPFHDGHKAVIEQALTQAKNVCVVIGSSWGPRSYRNPFTFWERSQMIIGEFNKEPYSGRVKVTGVEDSTYNDNKWVEDVQAAVMILADGLQAKTIALAGHKKDNSSFYLNLFPQWTRNGIITVNEPSDLSATDLRNDYFIKGDNCSNAVPLSTFNFLVNFRQKNDYQLIREEYLFIQNYKKSWDSAPYPVKHVTVDACVVQSGHILLVQRGARPGRDLWALPGGHLELDERIEDGIFRELKEETKIKVPLAVLKGNLKTIKVFDDPHRSSRGRTITHAGLIALPPGELPKIKGSDDAKYAQWWPLTEVNREMMFEDHYDMIINLTNLL